MGVSRGGAFIRPGAAVVIPTLNRPRYAAAVVRALVAQVPEDTEIVVVDQSDDLEPLAVAIEALADPRVVHLRTEPIGLPHARNIGIRATVAPVVLFVDDDVELLPGLVEAHLAEYDQPRVGGVVGRIVERRVLPNAPATTNRVGWDGRVRTNLSGTERVHVEALQGANMSVRRSALAEIGGFDGHYRGTALLEDADIAARLRSAGWEVWFAPRAELIHLSAPSGGVRQPDPLRTERWRFHNTAYFVRRHRTVWAWPALYATFAAIAARRAVQWRQPRAAGELIAALREGWALAGGPPDVDDFGLPL